MGNLNWLSVKDADIETLKEELIVSPEFEDKAVERFQRFCRKNGFDQFMRVNVRDFGKIKDVLSGGSPDELAGQMPDLDDMILKYKPNALWDHAPCLFQNSKTGRRCIVTQPYPPLCRLKDKEGEQEREKWLKDLDLWARETIGVNYKVLPDASYYWHETWLVAFYIEGNISG